MMNLDENKLFLCLKGLKSVGANKWMSLCPAHADSKPSLSIIKRPDGFLFLKCFAGCSFQSIIKELNMNNGHNDSKRIIDKVYSYTDECGNIVHRTVRYKPKSFSQQRPDEHGNWVNNLEGVKTVLYNLPNVIKANEIIVVEGEKDVDNLIALDFTATTNPMGAGKWKPRYSKVFKNKKVVIIPDNDKPGRDHALNIASQLHKVAWSVKILELPGLPEKGDVTDFINIQPSSAAAHERLSIMIEGCKEWMPEIKSESSIIFPSNSSNYKFPLTEVGNAERLVKSYGSKIRYCPHLKNWFIWNGKAWKGDDIQKIKSLAKLTVRAIYTEITKGLTSQEANEISKHAQRSETDYRINSMINLAQSEPGIAILPIELDHDPWLFNCQNGTVNLQTGVLQPHSPADFNSKISSVIFDPNAQCPVFLDFLNRIFSTNQSLISYIQRILGYSLTGDSREQCFFMLYGSGANGKSTLLEIFRTLMGNYARNAAISTFLVQKNSSIPNDIAYLHGARFVSSIELEHGKSLSEAFVKQVTGGDIITARQLYKEFFEFTPAFKVFIATNHKPNVHGTDEGIWRRIRLIPFEVAIPESERDKNLLQKLKNELSGIFNWTLKGCLDWQKFGLGDPQEVVSATQLYRNEMDVIGDFIDDCCVLQPDAIVKFNDLYVAYCDWCKTLCEDPLTDIQFGKSLTERGYPKKRTTRGKSLRLGIGLRSDK